MTEYVCECKDFAIACEGEWEETVVCKECGGPAISKEIIKALNATKRFSAEDARMIVPRILPVGVTTPELRQAMVNQQAYADTLEG